MQSDKREIISLELPTKIIQLILTPFDTDVDIEDLLRVQEHNIYGELITISRLMNKVGNLKAEMDEILSTAKLDFDIFYAQMQEKKKNELMAVGKATVADIESAIIRTPEYKVKKLHIFKVQKNLDYIASLVESVKNKSFIVMKISDKLKPEEFEKEIVEGSVNGVMVKIAKKLIK